MAKTLRSILPKTGYKPRSKGEQDFANLHTVEVEDDREGNSDEIFSASNRKKADYNRADNGGPEQDEVESPKFGFNSLENPEIKVRKEEELTELSDRTLQSYEKKAKKRLHGFTLLDKETRERFGHSKLEDNRKEGVEKVQKKLKKEEEELTELTLSPQYQKIIDSLNNSTEAFDKLTKAADAHRNSFKPKNTQAPKEKKELVKNKVDLEKIAGEWNSSTEAINKLTKKKVNKEEELKEYTPSENFKADPVDYKALAKFHFDLQKKNPNISSKEREKLTKKEFPALNRFTEEEINEFFEFDNLPFNHEFNKALKKKTNKNSENSFDTSNTNKPQKSKFSSNSEPIDDLPFNSAFNKIKGKKPGIKISSLADNSDKPSQEAKPILNVEFGKKKVNKEEENLNEKITARTPTSKVIHDFVHSDNPKFAGKSKEERIKMALGASYSLKKENEEIEENELVDTIKSIKKDLISKYKPNKFYMRGPGPKTKEKEEKEKLSEGEVLAFQPRTNDHVNKPNDAEVVNLKTKPDEEKILHLKRAKDYADQVFFHHEQSEKHSGLADKFNRIGDTANGGLHEKIHSAHKSAIKAYADLAEAHRDIYLKEEELNELSATVYKNYALKSQKEIDEPKELNDKNSVKKERNRKEFWLKAVKKLSK